MIQNSNYHKSDSGILSYDCSSSGKRLRNSHSSKKDRRVHPRREQNPLKPSLFIASAAVNMVKGAFRFPPCFVLAAAAFALYLFFNVSCVMLVVMGIIGGLLISEYYERKGAGRRA